MPKTAPDPTYGFELQNARASRRLGGVNCAILVCFVCQRYPHAAAATIVGRFFRIFDSWDWPNPVLIAPPQRPPTPAELVTLARRIMFFFFLFFFFFFFVFSSFSFSSFSSLWREAKRRALCGVLLFWRVNTCMPHMRRSRSRTGTARGIQRSTRGTAFFPAFLRRFFENLKENSTSSSTRPLSLCQSSLSLSLDREGTVFFSFAFPRVKARPWRRS